MPFLSAICQSTAYMGPTLTAIPRKSPATMTVRSSTHDYPSESTAYIESYPDGYLSESLLKDGDSPT